jgi:hypothetical protein
MAAEHAICVNRINGEDLVSIYLSDYIPVLLENGNTIGLSNVAF